MHKLAAVAGIVVASREPFVFVRDLTKRYARLTALSGVSFSIRRNEVLGLIGPNGSGKTTLFECLGGVLPIDEGTIENGSGPLTPSERAGLLFYLPDSIAPWPSQRVGWLLDYVTGLFGGRAEPHVRRSSRELGLEPLLDAPLGSLSKGQRKRALLAMGLLTPQPVLLSDEPFDGLDLRQTRDVARRCAPPRTPAARWSCRSIRSAMPRGSATGSCSSATAGSAAKGRSTS